VDSPIAELPDGLIDPFIGRVANHADRLCTILRKAFELDDDFRRTILRDSADQDWSTEQAWRRSVHRFAVIAHRLRGLFNSLAVDSPLPDQFESNRQFESNGQIESIWQHSFKVGCVAAVIAQKGRQTDPVEAFACGMVHDVGRLALAVQFPKAIERVDRAMRSGERNVLEVESRICGADHATVGGHLLSRWALPDALQHVARYHHLRAQDSTDSIAGARHVEIVRDAVAYVERANDVHVPRTNTKDHEIARAFDQMTREIEENLIRMDRTSMGVDDDRPGLDRARQEDLPGEEVSAVPLVHLYRFMQQAVELPGRVGGIDDLCKETARIVFDLLGMSRLVVFAQVGSTQFRTCTFDASPASAEPKINSRRAIVCNPVSCPPSGSEFENEAAGVRGAEGSRYNELSDRFVRFLGPGSIDCLAFQHGMDQPGGILFSADDDGWRWNRVDSASLRSMALTLGAAFESMRLRRQIQVQAGECEAMERVRSTEHQAAVQAESMSRVARMAAGAAHELNNPLAIVAGRAQILQADPKNESIQSDLQLIAAQARRAGELVSQMMDYARPAKPQPVGICLLDWANRLRQRWYRRSGLDADQIQVRFQTDDLTVFADERQLWDSADEIMANAVEALRQKNGPCATKSGEIPYILINSPSASTDDTIVVAISDNGRGMPPEVCKHALDPFFSHRAAGRRQGLGLSRAARHIEINGGRLWIESTEGTGTTVRFSLPSHSTSPFGP
jgi:signal transduction histidine kinase